MTPQAAFLPTSPLSRPALIRHSLHLSPTRRRDVSHFRPKPRPLRICAENSNDASRETTLIPELEALEPDSGSVIVAPTFNLAGAFLFTGGLSMYQGNLWVVLGLPLVLIGSLLSVQTLRVRFIFGPTRLSVAKRTSDGLQIIRGWRYDGITNWEFWWKKVPVLVYFKENESYAGRGSIHFFPILFNGTQLLEQLVKNTPHLDKSNYL